jgi:glycosyltransferase involved in cell wall biosynthesis
VTGCASWTPTEVVRRRIAGPPAHEPLVSVVVSTRNHSAYLAETVSAVSAQDIEGVELILVDNASTDRTERLVHTLLDGVTIPVTYLRLGSDYGPARGRNVGMAEARGRFVAFTDSDCAPTPAWLRSALVSFEDVVGIVQGRTECASARPPLLCHFIETRRFDGSFSTSNVVYRREALGSLRFDPRCTYWEDTDLGWRVRADGWAVKFAQDALVHHQVIPQKARRWVLWPTRYSNWPAKAAAYPEFRRSLFLGVWVRPLHLWFQMALAGCVGARRRRWALVLTLPYCLSFVRQRRLAGRAPAGKFALYVARDLVGLVSLLAGSARHRTVVL